MIYFKMRARTPVGRLVLPRPTNRPIGAELSRVRGLAYVATLGYVCVCVCHAMGETGFYLIGNPFMHAVKNRDARKCSVFLSNR